MQRGHNAHLPLTRACVPAGQVPGPSASPRGRREGRQVHSQARGRRGPPSSPLEAGTSGGCCLHSGLALAGSSADTPASGEASRFPEGKGAGVRIYRVNPNLYAQYTQLSKKGECVCGNFQHVFLKTQLTISQMLRTDALKCERAREGS